MSTEEKGQLQMKLQGQKDDGWHGTSKIRGLVYGNVVWNSRHVKTDYLNNLVLVEFCKLSRISIRKRLF